MTSLRLDAGGSMIDRARPLQFRWGRTRLAGLAGDTLASALMANGESVFARSFKYHRPRGLLAAGLEEPNAIVQWQEGRLTSPNLKATTLELHDGLIAAPVNAWPSPQFDLLAANGWIKRFIPAAFYYKTFIWPHWHLFEPAIRRAAGLGLAPVHPDPDSYAQHVDQVDCLVVGAGLAGLQEAASLARQGKKVILAESDPWPGGAIFGPAHDTERAQANRLAAELSACPNVRVLLRTTVLALQDDGLVTMLERLTDHLPVAQRQGPRHRLWKLRARDLVLATGAHERPLVFDGNDRPGVMLASAAGQLLERQAVSPGRRLVLAANNDRAWDAALALAMAGLGVAGIMDARTAADPARVAVATVLGIRMEFETVPWRARGSRHITAVETARIIAGGAARPTGTAIACDTLLMSGGYSPVVHLHGQAGGQLVWHDGVQAFLPVPGALPCRMVGAAAGDGLGHVRPVWHISADPRRPSAKAFVDFQNDVTAADVALARSESFRAVEHLKRYTTLGMATDQGKTSNINGLAIMGGLAGLSPDTVGTTRFRPPYEPAPIGAFAGHRVGQLLRPVRRLPAHAAHASLGARFEEYGLWERPSCYPKAGETEADAVFREAAAVRAGVGLFDASPLGKIEVKGPDAANFLDRIYVGRVSTLRPGGCRYGLILNEHGIILDDGIVARIADDHFLVGTTSSNARIVHQHLEEWLQCEWPQLLVAIADVTQQWAVMNVAGPNARRLLEGLACDIDLDGAAFAHLGHREGHVEGVPCRMQRVSYTGELSFELAVPSRFALALHARLLACGADLGIVPFGIEAMMVLRTEKGFLHLGSDTDGTTFPDDVGFGAPVRLRKDDFIGRRSCLMPEAMRPDRRQLVGLQSVDGTLLPIGGHVLGKGQDRQSQGWVTSSVNSPALGRAVALAMVCAGRSRHGEEVVVWNRGGTQRARIVSPVAFDPKGERMHG
ncbi:MAG: (2Fe-2S)-binding protein [Alphaproteobacteria bacterium]|nr:(2Fe-2S)-binding protein [Alphaproteobacteria bacterium]